MFNHQLTALGEHIHVNKQLIITMRINNNHADELILTEFTHFHTAHIYKQIADKILINIYIYICYMDLRGGMGG